MFAMIGFGFLIMPFIGIGAYGLKRLYCNVGAAATGVLIVSVPFYITTLMTLFRAIQYAVVAIKSGEDLDFFTQFSELGIFSIVAWIVCLILFKVFAEIHNRSVSPEE